MGKNRKEIIEAAKSALAVSKIASSHGGLKQKVKARVERTKPSSLEKMDENELFNIIIEGEMDAEFLADISLTAKDRREHMRLAKKLHAAAESILEED